MINLLTTDETEIFYWKQELLEFFTWISYVKKIPKVFIFASSPSWLLINLVSIKKTPQKQTPQINSYDRKKMIMSSIGDLSWNKFKQKRKLCLVKLLWGKLAEGK